MLTTSSCFADTNALSPKSPGKCCNDGLAARTCSPAPSTPSAFAKASAERSGSPPPVKNGEDETSGCQPQVRELGEGPEIAVRRQQRQIGVEAGLRQKGVTRHRFPAGAAHARAELAGPSPVSLTDLGCLERAPPLRIRQRLGDRRRGEDPCLFGPAIDERWRASVSSRSLL